MTQDTNGSVWQHTGQQHGGRGPLVLCGELPGLEEGILQLCRYHRFWKLPEELLHQTCHVTGKSS